MSVLVNGILGAEDVTPSQAQGCAKGYFFVAGGETVRANERTNYASASRGGISTKVFTTAEATNPTESPHFANTGKLRHKRLLSFPNKQLNTSSSSTALNSFPTVFSGHRGQSDPAQRRGSRRAPTASKCP